MMLYKYQAIHDYSTSALTQGKLWCSRPESFNDPFEFRGLEASHNAKDIEELITLLATQDKVGIKASEIKKTKHILNNLSEYDLADFLGTEDSRFIEAIAKYSIGGMSKNDTDATEAFINEYIEYRIISQDLLESNLQKSLTEGLTEIINVLNNAFLSKFTSKVLEMLREYGIISFSEVCDNLLMWSHYGGNHYGICLGFEVENTRVNNIYKVKYTNKYPNYKINEMLAAENRITYVTKLINKVTCTKSIDWKYEKEWRQLFENESDCLQPYPGKLVEIVLGARITETNKEKIKSILKGRSVIIKQAKRHSAEYKLIIDS